MAKIYNDKINLDKTDHNIINYGKLMIANE